MSHPRHPQQGHQPGYPEKKAGAPPPTSYYQPPPGYQQMPPHQVQGAPPPPYAAYPQQQIYPQQPITYMHVQPMQAGAFDAGARFDNSARPNIPPPPPGVAPNAAQAAAAQGQPVLMQQRQAGWVEGGQGAGYTFW